MERMKPFDFLRGHVRPQMKVAFETLDSLGLWPRTDREAANAPLAERVATHELGAGDLAAADRRSRLIAVIDPNVGGDIDAFKSRCIQVAFNGTDSTECGTAWIALADLWRSSAERSSLLSMLVVELRRRFHITSLGDIELTKVTEMWIDGAAMYLSGLERNRRLSVVIDGYVEAHAGNDAPAMRQSVEAAASFLTHPDPARRLAALTVVGRAGAQARHLQSQIRERVLAEEDPKLQVAAVYSFNAAQARTMDREAVRFLAGLVRDRSVHVGARFAAYDGLFSVLGMATNSPIARLGDDPSQISKIVNGFDDYVDWDFVNEWGA